jgi:hypothetical protein
MTVWTMVSGVGCPAGAQAPRAMLATISSEAIANTLLRNFSSIEMNIEMVRSLARFLESGQ